MDGNDDTSRFCHYESKDWAIGFLEFDTGPADSYSKGRFSGLLLIELGRWVM